MFLNKILKISLFSFLLFVTVFLSAQEPAVLSSFTAQFVNNNIIIDWITESEENISHWNIYRAEENTLEAAIKINASHIYGAGTTSEQTWYQYEDNYGFTYGITYYYWLECVDFANQTHIFGPLSIVIESPPEPPVSEITKLVGNYPNPFCPSTIIGYLVKEGEVATLAILNSKRQVVQSVQVGATPPIGHQFYWNGWNQEDNNVTSGIYYCTLESPTYFGEITMVLVNMTETDTTSIGNYPNPFNPETTIFFYANEPGKVEITIFNEKGQKVKTLAKGFYGVGQHSELWNGTDDNGKAVSGGLYFYQVKKNGKIDAVKKCLLLK